MDLRNIAIVVGVVASAFAAFFYIDSTYASAESTKQLQKSVLMLNQRLEVYIIRDKIDAKEEQIARKEEKMRTIEDKYGHKDSMRFNPLDRDRYRELEGDIRRLKKEIKNLNLELNGLLGGKP